MFIFKEQDQMGYADALIDIRTPYSDLLARQGVNEAEKTLSQQEAELIALENKKKKRRTMFLGITIAVVVFIGIYYILSNQND